eukprot:s2934_g6.t1
MAQGLAAKDGSLCECYEGGVSLIGPVEFSEAPTLKSLPDRAPLCKERDAHMLQQQLVRERMENQRHAQAARTKDEELLRSEHAVRSLREQKVQLERQMSQLRGDLARSEAARQREVSDLKARLSTCEANHEREMLALEREAAPHSGHLRSATATASTTPVRVPSWEVACLESFFHDLYSPSDEPVLPPLPALTAPQITVEEATIRLGKLPVHKATPSHLAPTATTVACADILAP